MYALAGALGTLLCYFVVDVVDDDDDDDDGDVAGIVNAMCITKIKSITDYAVEIVVTIINISRQKKNESLLYILEILLYLDGKLHTC